MAKTVQVVDDDRDFLDLLEAVLAPEGYRVVSCADPAQAYAEARRVHPDVLVVDLLMPVCSGWQIIEQVRADPTLAGLPIIVCTAALPELSQHAAALRQWNCHILLKPFELDELLSLVKRLTARDQAS